MLRNDAINPEAFAVSVRALLDEDPRRYRNFGIWWFMIKNLLRRFYDRHEMPQLGTFVDTTVIDRMPWVQGLNEGLLLAAETYQHNATFNPCNNEQEDDEGQHFTLLDPDIEG